MRKRTKASDLVGPLHETEVSTTVISNRDLTLDGVKFQWWAVGEDPSLVTVRSSIFGTMAKFTTGDPAAFAEALAKKVLAQHYERAARLRKASEERSQFESQSKAMVKRGWFE